MAEITRGDRNIQWIEAYCFVPEGKMVGRPLVLRPWQREIIKGIYDTPTRSAIISFGRKNGKTALTACLLLLHLVGPESVPNSQLYSAARSRRQAAVLFELAAKMVRMNPDLKDCVLIRDTAKELLCRELGTLYHAMSAEASTAHGTSPIFVVHDELGQVRGPRDDLYAALETGMGAHESPMSIVISTQAATDNDLLSILIDDALGKQDKETKIFLYTSEPDADPFCENTIRAANPALGDFLSMKEVKAAAEKARRVPTEEPDFRNLHLNQRVNAESPFIAPSIWRMNGAVPKPMDGRKVWIGIDLSTSRDLTFFATVAYDDGEVDVHSSAWLPGDGIKDKSQSDRVPYDLWEKQGFLNTTPGKTIRYGHLAAHLRKVFDTQDVQKVAFDPHKYQILEPLLVQEGFTEDELERFLPVQQTYKFMSPYLNELEAYLVEGKLRHGMHPVLTMCAANARVKEGRVTGDRLLAKPSDIERIDGIVALALAVGAMASDVEDAVPKSPWDDESFTLDVL
jgi:phage terminase large subunit-like protein